jgi:hypothetical protein
MVPLSFVVVPPSSRAAEGATRLRCGLVPVVQSVKDTATEGALVMGRGLAPALVSHYWCPRLLSRRCQTVRWSAVRRGRSSPLSRSAALAAFQPGAP